MRYTRIPFYILWIPNATFVFTAYLAQFCRTKGLERLIFTTTAPLHIYTLASIGMW